ncbi:MAG: hypothetical protein ACLUD0_10615 [Eubacterium ramulus]
MCNRTSKQLAGFILFWIGIGMIVMLFMPNDFVGILDCRRIHAAWRHIVIRCKIPLAARIFSVKQESVLSHTFADKIINSHLLSSPRRGRR